jgi:hypothetical protein
MYDRTRQSKGWHEVLETNLTDVLERDGSSISMYFDGNFEPFQHDARALFYLMSGVIS